MKTKFGSLEERIFATAKAQAERNGYPFTIQLPDVVVPSVCPVFGAPFNLDFSKKSERHPVLDAVDHRQGFIRGNVMVISRRADEIKGAHDHNYHTALLAFDAATIRSLATELYFKTKVKAEREGVPFGLTFADIEEHLAHHGTVGNRGRRHEIVVAR